MGSTFNALLKGEGVDPARVRLLRHHHRDSRLISPYRLWQTNQQEFDRYQATQDPLARSEFLGWLWASFVATAGNETLFVGLYMTELQGPVPDSWIDPISGRRAGHGRDRTYDLYRTTRLSALASYRGVVKIDWGPGLRTWNQRADKQNKAISWIGGATEQLDVADREASHEAAGVIRLENTSRSLDPERRRRISSYIERGPMGDQAKRYNGGRCQICTALDQDPIAFMKRDGTPYAEAHHVFPVAKMKPGSLGIENIMVLCPNHHREMHYGAIEIIGDRKTGWTIAMGDRVVEIERSTTGPKERQRMSGSEPGPKASAKGSEAIRAQSDDLCRR